MAPTMANTHTHTHTLVDWMSESPKRKKKTKRIERFFFGLFSYRTSRCWWVVVDVVVVDLVVVVVVVASSAGLVRAPVRSEAADRLSRGRAGPTLFKAPLRSRRRRRRRRRRPTRQKFSIEDVLGIDSNSGSSSSLFSGRLVGWSNLAISCVARCRRRWLAACPRSSSLAKMAPNCAQWQLICIQFSSCCVISSVNAERRCGNHGDGDRDAVAVIGRCWWKRPITDVDLWPETTAPFYHHHRLVLPSFYLVFVGSRVAFRQSQPTGNEWALSLS